MSRIGELLFRIKRWMYRGDRPGGLARFLNGVALRQHGAGVFSSRQSFVLEVRGRSSGALVQLPVVVLDHEGERYLVSMLGENVNWVKNVRAAGGEAVLRRRRREPVRLTDVDVARRAPILRRYLAVAPGARPHVTVDRHAPLADFERVADRYPVFRVGPR